ncbi:hypothetical protein Tco_1333378 [Tanacetum coccineum]
MSSPAYVDSETIPQTDGARSSRVPIPLLDDPYMAVRQAYLATDKVSDPSETRAISPSDPTAPLSPDHALTQTPSTRAFYYQGTARMAVRTPPTSSPGISAFVAEVVALSPSLFRKRSRPSHETPSPSPSSSSPTLLSRKRYHGASELIADTESKGLEADSKGEELKDEGPDSKEEEEEAVLEALGEDSIPSTFEVGRSSKIVPDQQMADRTPTPRSPTRSTWIDQEDDTVYLDIKIDPRSSPSSEPPVIPSPISTPILAEPEEESFMAELGVRIKLQGRLIAGHTQLLEALPSTFHGYDQDFTELYSRSRIVSEEIFSQRYRLRSRRGLYQREARDLRLQLAEERRARSNLTELVTRLERRLDSRE